MTHRSQSLKLSASLILLGAAAGFQGLNNSHEHVHIEIGIDKTVVGERG